MANTNLSKVERLGIKLRVGVATRLMDRVGYEAIREWLRTEGVAEEALPSDRSMNGYRETMEYGCLEQQQVDRCLGLGGAEQGEEEEACVVVMPSPEVVAATVLRRLELRLRVSDEVMVEYRTASAKANGYEEQLLEDLRQQWLDEKPIFPPASARRSVAAAADGEDGPDTDGYQVVTTGLDRSTRALLEGAAGLPEADREEVQLAAFWMRQRARLARDPRMLKPGVFLRMIAQLQASVKQLAAARSAAMTEQEAQAERPGAAAAAARTTPPASSQTPTLRATPPRGSGVPAASAPARPVGLRTDSAGFGEAVGRAAARDSQVATPAPVPRPGAAKAAPTPAGTPASPPNRAPSVGAAPGAPAMARPVGLRADSAGFRRPASERMLNALESACRKGSG